MDLLCQLVFFLGTVQLVLSGGTNYDPRRWIISYQKPASLSTTDGELYASFATDGNFENMFGKDDPLTNYSLSAKEKIPTFQIDFGEVVAVASVQISLPEWDASSKSLNNMKVRVGDNPAADSSENSLCFEGTLALWSRLNCRMKGRYVNLIRQGNAKTRLKLVEVAVFKRPLENVAYMKATARSVAYSDAYDSDKAVDMDDFSLWSTNVANVNHWIRVDLQDTYFVHEVLIFARTGCCENAFAKQAFQLRIGESLVENGNLNPLCQKYTLYIGEIKSIYCDMFGRYVNINCHGPASYVAEIIVNPETTDNVAALAEANANVAGVGSNYQPASSVDTFYKWCYVAKNTESGKRLWINLGANYNVAMIYIVNKATSLDSLVDFQISVGSSNVFSESTLCVPGLQSLKDSYAESFYCEPGRILGNHVFIDQARTDKQMSVCEVGVYEETKPKIMNSQRFVWAKEGDDVTLKCDVKGYPSPVTSWVRDTVVIKSASSSLQLSNLKLNDSAKYECWANNSNGFDARLFELKVTSGIRVCVGTKEIKYEQGQANSVNIKLRGDEWYRLYDPNQKRELQFQESPGDHAPLCDTWMQDGHPSLEDGVVPRTLCVKTQTHQCSTKYDISVRRCAHYYVYNFGTLHDISAMTFCLKTAKISDDLAPAITSVTRYHALAGKTYLAEESLQEPYECLVMCQIDKKCKSFNFSQKLQRCELNSGTRKEFLGNYVASVEYDYYEFGQGILIVAQQDL